jgi:hypothetical protein
MTTLSCQAVKKVQVVWTCKRVHDDAAVGTLVVVVLLPLSLSMYDREAVNNADGGGGDGGGGGMSPLIAPTGCCVTS